MEFQLVMCRLELEALRNQNNNNSNAGEQNLSKLDLKCFLEFRPGDDPEAVLISFEHCCNNSEVPQNQRIVILRSKICGELAKYSQMPLDQSRDFERFKQLIYTQLGITSEQLKKKFRGVTKLREEMYAQLGAKSISYLTKWLKQQHADSAEEIKEIVTLEQFYMAINGELKYLVKERHPKLYKKQLCWLTKLTKSETMVLMSQDLAGKAMSTKATSPNLRKGDIVQCQIGDIFHRVKSP
ncbi:hypothetical protein JRQ81_014230 [Phrynocephalus forsythii]|uniref:SCAN box domain-containing protein n=1 Tax=Phrynocephalus forsythii TaxID=171643 RepID=A0A9Q0XY79_9SAUR|nr:hypothetical protein JRQ81_014230 [Phrynocephalus forsythii]